MFGFKTSNGVARGRTQTDSDLAKLLFDAFSKRVSGVEGGMKTLSREVEKLKLSADRSQISDLVLLERLQRAEETLTESLIWIKRVANLVHEQAVQSRPLTRIPGRAAEFSVGPSEPASGTEAYQFRTADLGSLPSITTTTELQVLTLLAELGPKSAPEIGREIGRSREHSARLMKKLYEEGYVRRDQARVPFRYSLVDRVQSKFKKVEEKQTAEEHEQAAAPPA